MSRNEKTLKEILEQFARTKPIKNNLTEVRIKEAWKTQLGPSIQNYTSDMKFRNGILTVNLTSAPLRQELLYGQAKLIGLLNETLGEELIKEVKIY